MNHLEENKNEGWRNQRGALQVLCIVSKYIYSSILGKLSVRYYFSCFFLFLFFPPVTVTLFHHDEFGIFTFKRNYVEAYQMNMFTSRIEKLEPHLACTSTEVSNSRVTIITKILVARHSVLSLSAERQRIFSRTLFSVCFPSDTSVSIATKWNSVSNKRHDS